jgi:hypothetical protein
MFNFLWQVHQTQKTLIININVYKFSEITSILPHYSKKCFKLKSLQFEVSSKLLSGGLTI